MTIKASDHKHSTGKYRADVYLVDKDGNRQYLTETVVDVNETKPSGSISILNNNGAGTFDVVISDVYSPKGVRTVQVPVWSEADGQDDIRWYEATRQTDGNYKVTVQVANHKNVTGLYNVHLYYIQNDGSQIGVGAHKQKLLCQIPKPTLLSLVSTMLLVAMILSFQIWLRHEVSKKSWFQPGQKRTAKMISSGTRQLSKLMETIR